MEGLQDFSWRGLFLKGSEVAPEGKGPDVQVNALDGEDKRRKEALVDKTLQADALKTLPCRPARFEKLKAVYLRLILEAIAPCVFRWRP